jgi:hypothetical protein
MLVKLTDINQRAFDGAVASGENGLRGWNLIPWIACGLVLALVLAGIRPRLAEYGLAAADNQRHAAARRVRASPGMASES